MPNGIAVPVPRSDSRTSATCVGIRPTPRRVQRAVAHAEALAQALAASQQASTATRRHLANLDGVDAPLGAIPAMREEEVAKVPHLAYPDQVACLLDRNRLLDRLNHVLVLAERQQREITMLLCGLGGLPDLDVRLGRSAAGRLLQQTTERLSWCIRSGDATHGHDGCDAGLMSPGMSNRDDPNQAGEGSGNGSAAPPAVANQTIAAPAASGGVRHDGTGSATRRGPWKQPTFCLSAGLDPDATPQLERLLTNASGFAKAMCSIESAADSMRSTRYVRVHARRFCWRATDTTRSPATIWRETSSAWTASAPTFTGARRPRWKTWRLRRFRSRRSRCSRENSDRFRRNLHRLLSREGLRAQTLMIVLGTMRAEQRLAVFLLDLSQRYQARGYSSCEFVLRMTREEIGSHLGLKLETVSRLFSRLQREGLIQVQGRTVKMLDRLAVGQLVDCGA